MARENEGNMRTMLLGSTSEDTDERVLKYVGLSGTVEIKKMGKTIARQEAKQELR